MRQLTFTRAPLSFDEYGQPCYLVNQTKGLSESQDNQLLQGALLEGYISKVAQDLKNWVMHQVVVASEGRKVDLLEIGGGAGSFFNTLKDQVGSYINVEPGQINLAKEDVERLAHPNFLTIKCSAEEIPLPDGSLDVVISIASLDHVPNYRKALLEVSRVLRKNGVFIITLNNRRSWWKTLLARTSFLKSREEEIAREHYFIWSFAECKSNLSEYLELKSASSMTFFPFVPKLWRFALPPAEVVGRLMIPLRGANMLIVCRKSR
jgi:ubiquinone/menaquinone biosynthesis C-methylase UbiE